MELINIYFWKGHHDQSLIPLLTDAWTQKCCVIICPPYIEDTSYLYPFLPNSTIHHLGDWKNKNIIKNESNVLYSELPILGIFTSGTTRQKPKLVLYSKKNLSTTLDSLFSIFDTFKIKYIFSFPQPYHAFGLILGYLAAIHLKMELICDLGPTTPFALQYWLDLPKNIKSQLLTLGTPTHFLDLAHFLKSKNIKPDLSFTSICGGASVEKKLWHIMKNELNISFPSIGYGCTEASLAVTHLNPGTAPIEDYELGRPLPGINASLQTEGVTITGDSVCLAMIFEDRMEFPTEIIIKDKIEVRETDNVWIYRSRNDLLLNRGGEKYFLEDIEKVIKNELSIENICVAIKDERLGHELGIAVLKEKVSLSLIQTLLKNKFDNKFNNLKIAILDNFPINSSAKIDRMAITNILEKTI